jgi:murein DD-endopeptidase MepM/ murein hydrolase activator NlpD
VLLPLVSLLSLVTTAAPAGAREVPVGTWPLPPVPEVVAAFDPPATPYGRGHRGVDLAGWVGAPVMAALPGTVTYAGPLAGRGVVVVDHGPTRTTYQPVTASAAVGDVVGAGAVVGHLVVGGSHCAPRACLHWGWVEGETYLDPLLLVGAGPVRLLPLDGLPDPAPWGPWQPQTTWWAAQARGWAWR